MIVLNLSTFMEVNVFERIKRIAESKQIPMKRLIEAIGTTEQNYYRMVRLNSIKNTTLSKIFSFLRISESEFYSDNFSNTVLTMDKQVTEKQTEKTYPALDKTQRALIEKDLKMMEGLIKSIRETIDN
jgi:DNA-binding Xre family transcriptional regulator